MIILTFFFHLAAFSPLETLKTLIKHTNQEIFITLNNQTLTFQSSAGITKEVLSSFECLKGVTKYGGQAYESLNGGAKECEWDGEGLILNVNCSLCCCEIKEWVRMNVLEGNFELKMQCNACNSSGECHGVKKHSIAKHGPGAIPFILQLTPWTNSDSQEELLATYKKIHGFGTLLKTKRLSTSSTEALIFVPQTVDPRLYGNFNGGYTALFSEGILLHREPGPLGPVIVIVKRSGEDTQEVITKGVLEVLNSLSGDDLSNYGSFIRTAFIEANKENKKAKECLSHILPFKTTKGIFKLQDFCKEIEGDILYTRVSVKMWNMKEHPFFEGVKKDVLFVDGVEDEQVLWFLKEYEGRKVKELHSEGCDCGGCVSDEVIDEQQVKLTSEEENFLKFVKNSLKDNISIVRISKRLKKAPFTLIPSESQIPSFYKQLIGQNAIETFAFKDLVDKKPIFEINKDSEEIKILMKMSVVDPVKCTGWLVKCYIGCCRLLGFELSEEICFEMLESSRKDIIENKKTESANKRKSEL